MIKAFIGSATALALMATAAAPAAARPYWGGHHRHHGGGDTFGNILLGGVIAGGIFAIANASKRNQGTPSRRADDQRDDLRADGEDAREVASICTNAIETMARGPVSSVDSVGRDGPDGWRVEGVVRGERGDRSFRCAVREGQIEMVDLGEQLAAR